MSKNRYQGCESGSDFTRQAKGSKHLVTFHCAGDHTTVYGPYGRETLDNGKYEYPPHTRRKIAAKLLAIGLALVVLVVITVPVLL